MSELLKVLRDNSVSWEDSPFNGSVWTTTSMVLDQSIVNQVKKLFTIKRIFKGKTIYSYKDGDTSYRVWVS